MKKRKITVTTPITQTALNERKKERRVSNILLFFLLTLTWIQKFFNQSLIKEVSNQWLLMLLFLSVKQITNCVANIVLSVAYQIAQISEPFGSSKNRHFQV